MSGEILRKLTVKGVLSEIPDTFAEGETYKPLVHVYGMANGTKRDTSQYGAYAKLIGQFEMVNLATGEVSQSPMLIMPEPMNETIACAVESGAKGIQFSFEIGIKPGQKRAGKQRQVYEWVTRELIPMTDADPLSDMRQAVKALPAPKPETGKGKSK